MAIGANNVAGKITVTGEVVTKGFSDFKAKVDSAIGVATKLASTLDEVLERNGKFTAMLSANTLSIDAARAATGGLVDDFTLLSAANRATALGLGMTADQFAEVASAATVMSRKLGTDATDAVNDLITGIGRQSVAILDNLGIIVKAEDAYDSYAAGLGKTANELTAVEKRAAFQQAALEKLNEAVGDQTVQVNNAAGAWQRIKTGITNTKDALAAVATNAKGTAVELSIATRAMEWFDKAFRSATPQVDQHILTLKRYAEEAKAELADLQHKFGSSGLMAPSVAEPLTIGGIPTELRGGKGKRESRSGGEIDVERFRPAFGEGLELGGLDQRAENIKAIDMEIAADNRWIDAELQKQAVLERSITLMQDMEFAANTNAQNAREWVSSINDVTAGVGEFTAGLWSAADAAIVSGESFGQAVLKQVKAELMGVAARSTIAALYFTGMGFASLAGFNPVSASQWFTAAGIMAAVAAAAGAGALGISSATSKSSGSSAGRSREAPGSSVSSHADQKREREKEINVYVYLGDKYDRSAQLYMRRTAEAAA